MFDDDQLILLYLQEKFSIKDLKEQRTRMKIYDSLDNVNSVANTNFLDF